MHEITVIVTRRPDRRFYTMRYVDPMSGKPIARSTGTADHGLAKKAAAVWEDELRTGRYAVNAALPWGEFRDRYDQVLAGLAKGTQDKATTILDTLEAILNLEEKKLGDITAPRLTYFVDQLRKSGTRKETTIASYLSHLKAVLNWAVEQGYLVKAPKMPKVQRAKTLKIMKGRPITGEEFDRMLAKVEAGLLMQAKGTDKRLLAPKKRTRCEAAQQRQQEAQQSLAAGAAPSRRYFLEGLWWSGLRLGESLNLWWDSENMLRIVDLESSTPMMRIPAALEKGNQERLLPLAPEFVEFLRQTPASGRTGPVFNLRPLRGTAQPLMNRVSKTICKIGEAAGVKVNTDAKGKVKYASAHDLRRAFGERWAALVMPQQLMQMMRHESIETTMRYYVGRNAKTASDAIWEAYRIKQGASFSASRQESQEIPGEHSSQPKPR